MKVAQTLIPLTKFIESNANIEEYKLLKNNTLFSQSKASKKAGDLIKENNVKTNNINSKVRTTTPTNLKKKF